MQLSWEHDENVGFKWMVKSHVCPKEFVKMSIYRPDYQWRFSDHSMEDVMFNLQSFVQDLKRKKSGDLVTHQINHKCLSLKAR